MRGDVTSPATGRTTCREQIVNNWLSWAFLPQWEGHVGVRWVGDMYGNDANTYKRPAFTVVNLGLDYDVTEKSEIALRVYNVFDEVYATEAARRSGSSRRRAPARWSIASSTETRDRRRDPSRHRRVTALF